MSIAYIPNIINLHLIGKLNLPALDAEILDSQWPSAEFLDELSIAKRTTKYSQVISE
jgi:hypothetical protein